jgi:hypothetical protein
LTVSNAFPALDFIWTRDKKRSNFVSQLINMFDYSGFHFKCLARISIFKLCNLQTAVIALINQKIKYHGQFYVTNKQISNTQYCNWWIKVAIKYLPQVANRNFDGKFNFVVFLRVVLSLAFVTWRCPRAETRVSSIITFDLVELALFYAVYQQHKLRICC